ncbi:Metallopeptidase, catalytic domain protein [Metarhizium robertsii ARSEF 23]|uniref:Metallopeptidase, catalytic domain protein n=1 Tax=Metarhizium robertsii (strain ARSEF 23 / ATCC MYA-3075) TaxID=655844 RepID=E9FE16_METRA|nr:Metallopeptidase, catalytic domain protein [Metarhizium robertsii ARSEF 23]EFY94021.1 Metallopeptidase, catalytic domain protein [Metarhizium robertsii ARSEF 23]
MLDSEYAGPRDYFFLSSLSIHAFNTVRMLMLPFLISGLMASESMAGTIHSRSPSGHYCGTRSLSLEESELLKRQAPQPDHGGPINLGFVMHFCCNGNQNCPSNDVAQETVDQMNTIFKVTGINFNLENVTHISNRLCNAGLDNDQAIDMMKSEIRQGNTSTLNIVYVPTNQGAGTKGKCILPPPSAPISQTVGSIDGCAVAMDTLPKSNGSNSPSRGDDVSEFLSSRSEGDGANPIGSSRSEGDGANPIGLLITTTHETGHWLGLEHVEQGGQAQRPGRHLNGPFGRLFGRQRGSGTGNVMEPFVTPGKQYEFSQAQSQQMRQVALRRVKEKQAPIRGQNSPPKTPQGPKGPQIPDGNPRGPSGSDNGPVFPGAPGGNGPQGPNGPQTPGQIPGSPSGPGIKPGKPGFPAVPGFPGENGSEGPTNFPPTQPQGPSGPGSQPGFPDVSDFAGTNGPEDPGLNPIQNTDENTDLDLNLISRILDLYADLNPGQNSDLSPFPNHNPQGPSGLGSGEDLPKGKDQGGSSASPVAEHPIPDISGVPQKEHVLVLLVYDYLSEGIKLLIEIRIN